MRAAFALALVSIPAVAQVPEIIATMPNRDNSKISFTSLQWNCEPDQKLVYAQSDGGKISVLGCYQLIGDQVFVKWSDGDVYTYDVDSLTLTADFQAYMKKNK